jgi:hypothetical protein
LKSWMHRLILTSCHLGACCHILKSALCKLEEGTRNCNSWV